MRIIPGSTSLTPAAIAALLAVASAASAALATAAPALAKPHHAHAQPAPPATLPSGGTAPVLATPTPDSPVADKLTPPPPMLPGMSSYILVDDATGAVLAEAAPHLQVAPASLTKLMTAYLSLQALRRGTLKPDETVPVSVEAWHAIGSRMFIDPKTPVTVDQLMHGLIIDSGNDAAIALAEAVAGTEGAFVTMMSRTGKNLGLTDTTYVNATGLPDPDLHSSAADVAKLSEALIAQYPEILKISAQKQYTYNNITQQSWNPVLFHDPTVDGLKTGLTDESGHCIDATALRGGRRLIAVVMGGPSWSASTAAIEALLDYGYKNFADVSVAAPGETLGTLTSADLDPQSVAAGVSAPIVLTLPVDAQARLLKSVAFSVDPSAGFHKGDTIGTFSVSLDGKTLATAPLVALADGKPAGLITRLMRAVKKAI